MNELEQARDLLLKFRAARGQMMETGMRCSYSQETMAPKEYNTADVIGRFDSVWWILQMAINDVTNMVKEWENEDRKIQMP